MIAEELLDNIHKLVENSNYVPNIDVFVRVGDTEFSLEDDGWVELPLRERYDEYTA